MPANGLYGGYTPHEETVIIHNVRHALTALQYGASEADPLRPGVVLRAVHGFVNGMSAILSLIHTGGSPQEKA